MLQFGRYFEHTFSWKQHKVNIWNVETEIFFNLLKFEYGASNMFCFVFKKTVGVLHYMFLAMLCKETDFQYLWLL